MKKKEGPTKLKVISNMFKGNTYIHLPYIPIGVQKPGPSYSPAIYTIDIAYKIDIPL